MHISRRVTGMLMAIILLMTQNSCGNRGKNHDHDNNATVELADEESFPDLPELSEPISTNLAYRSNTSITGYIDGWQKRLNNLDAVMIMNGDTTILYRQRVMLVDDFSHYAISESAVPMYNENGNILFVPGKSETCPYSYDVFTQDSLVVDESGIPTDFDFKLKNITQEQWREILKDIAPIRIRKDYPIKPVLYFDKGDNYKYAVLFSAHVRDKGIVCCGFDYNNLPDTESGKYFKKALLTYTYLFSQYSYEIPQELGCNLTEWLEIFDFEH